MLNNFFHFESKHTWTSQSFMNALMKPEIVFNLSGLKTRGKAEYL